MGPFSQVDESKCRMRVSQGCWGETAQFNNERARASEDLRSRPFGSQTDDVARARRARDWANKAERQSRPRPAQHGHCHHCQTSPARLRRRESSFHPTRYAVRRRRKVVTASATPPSSASIARSVAPFGRPDSRLHARDRPLPGIRTAMTTKPHGSFWLGPTKLGQLTL